MNKTTEILKAILKKNPLILVILMVLLFVQLNYSQETTTGYVMVKGVVVEGKSTLNKAKVILFEGNKNVEEKTTSPGGKFMFKLDLRKEYIISFEKEGYVSKKVSFSTVVPESENGIWEYKFSLELFEMIEGLDVSFLDKPISKIKYYEFSADFDYDNEYTKSMMSRLERMMEEAEALKNSEYQDLIDKADGLYSQEKYEEALDLYDAAIDVNPYSEYPDQKIFEITRYLKKKDAIDEAFNRAIAEADKNYDIQNYEPALSFYQRALSLKSIEEYPQNRIAEIENLLKELNADDETSKEVEREYKKAITDADFALRKEEFENAKEDYNKAINIKPNEQYPKDQ